MTPLTFLGMLATASGLATTVLPLLQIGKMLRERNGHALALPWAVFPVVNAGIWCVYAETLGNLPLELTNGVYLGVSALLAATTLHLRRRYPLAPVTRLEPAPDEGSRALASRRTLVDAA